MGLISNVATGGSTRITWRAAISRGDAFQSVLTGHNAEQLLRELEEDSPLRGVVERSHRDPWEANSDLCRLLHGTAASEKLGSGRKLVCVSKR